MNNSMETKYYIVARIEANTYDTDILRPIRHTHSADDYIRIDEIAQAFHTYLQLLDITINKVD